MAPRRFWHEMTTRDFAEGDAASWIAVQPVAAIEQHGPHLPVYTDA
jgi:creatinine amidohydrolase